MDPYLGIQSRDKGAAALDRELSNRDSATVKGTFSRL